VACHADLFAPDATDEEWLEQVVKDDFVVLTMDGKMVRRRAIQDIVMHSGARLLYLRGGSAVMPQVAQNFVNTQPRIERFLSRRDAPIIVRVSRPSGSAGAIAVGVPGEVSLYMDRAEWERRRR